MRARSGPEGVRRAPLARPGAPGRRRTALEVALGALFGGALGGVLTLSLALSSAEWNPWLWAPVALGFLVGLLYGDRGLRAVARVVGWGG